MTNSNPPNLYRMVRVEDESGVSGTGHVADVVVWHDGTCAVHWRTAHTSTSVYASFGDVLAIHGHGGKTRLEQWPETPFENARRCAQVDAMENAPFASIGGPSKRGDMQRPRWVSELDWREWRTGYEFEAETMYGADWRTCTFGWVPALTIGGNQ